MSRVGRKPIEIPDKVEIKIEPGKFSAKGPLGEVSQRIPRGVGIEKKDGEIVVSLEREQKNGYSVWGLVRTLVQNAVIGVSRGFKKELELQGIGYKVSVVDNKVHLEVGYSHPIEIVVPQNLGVEVKKNVIAISGPNKQEVGEFAAKIRSIRPPEPYKGKGIRYVGEKVRRKEGKKATSSE